jgi:FkbH-like protein
MGGKVKTECLAIVGPQTWAPLVPLVGEALRAYGIEATVRAFGFDDEMAVLAGRHSAFFEAVPRGTFFLPDARALFRGWLRDPRRAGDAEADGTQAAAFLVESIGRLAQRLPQTTWVIGALAPPTPNSGDGIGDPAANDPFTAATAAFNRQLWKGSAEGKFYVLDATRLQAEYGSRTLFDPRMDQLARFPGSAAGMKRMAERMAALWAAIVGRMKKVLALDCDNTLWGGIVGEDGVDGIQLGDDGLGHAFTKFQESLLALEARGILLALCSRNNPQDVEEVFARRPEMIIPRDRIAAAVIGWDAKSGNLQKLANQLGLGLDSIVFLDDNPREREEVRQALPMVTVPEFPSDPADLAAFGYELGWRWFQRIRLSEEDRLKTDQYRARASTEELRQSAADPADFLRSLAMQSTIAVNDRDQVFRLAQLTQKTNQFNLTLRRYTEAEVREMMAKGTWRLCAGTLADRFGDHGVVAALFAEKSDAAWRLDVLLLSCRVLGRTFEQSFAAAVIEQLRREGPSAIEAEFVRGPRNAQTECFYKDLGFAVDSCGAPDRLRYHLAADQALDAPDQYIKFDWKVCR